MAIDDANHLYFVDTNVTDITFTSWNISGLGQYSLTQHRPVLPAGESVDDRPWIDAHGDGHVFYFGNQGDKVTYPLGQTCGTATGPGRYTVYQSYDGGETFNTLGCTLADSGWCRPAVDHKAPYQYVYVICTNDGGSDDVISPVDPVGTLWAYVSSDDGQTFTRYKMGSYAALDTTTSWPTAVVAPDGSIWALYVDAAKLDEDNAPITNKLVLFHSTDHGQTWKSQDITPMKGRYHYSWLSISQNGKKLGVGLYYRPNNTSDWHVYGAIFSPGSKPALTLIDPVSVQDKHCNTAPGDLLGSDFNPSGTLDVVWTRNTDPTTCGLVTVRDIYFAHSN